MNGGKNLSYKDKAAEQNRTILIDILKAFAICFVIMNHSGLFDRKNDPIFLIFIDKAVPIFMILSGYLLALTCEKKSAAELFNLEDLKRKFLRLTIPTLISYIISLSIKVYSNDKIQLIQIVKDFILGKYGLGSYYYGLMVQFLIVGPAILLLIRKYNTHGLVFCGLFNFVYDACCSFHGLNVSYYRVIIFRYVLYIALGIFLFLLIRDNKKIQLKTIIEMISAGMIYVFLPSKWDYTYRIFTYDPWQRTSMISALYVFPIIYLLFVNYKDVTADTKIKRFISKIGQASYHIMYTQMIFYLIRPGFNNHVFDLSRLNMVLQLAINLTFSVASGLLFYYMDNKIFGFAYRKRTKKNIKNKTEF